MIFPIPSSWVIPSILHHRFSFRSLVGVIGTVKCFLLFVIKHLKYFIILNTFVTTKNSNKKRPLFCLKMGGYVIAGNNPYILSIIALAT